MFLATTALTEFWDTSQELHFLGEWCLRADRESDWKAFPRRVLPCPWDDREFFYAQAGYVDRCAEKWLGPLGEALNRLHKTAYSTRSWRVLIGCWWVHFTQALYDRYVCLKAALEKSPSLGTWVLDPSAYRTPSDTSTAVNWLLSDPYNLQLYSQLLHNMGRHFPTKPLSNIDVLLGGASAPRPTSPSAIVRDASKSLLAWSARGLHRFFGGRVMTLLAEMYVSPALMWPLAIRSRLALLPLEMSSKSQRVPSFSPDPDRRSLLLNLGQGDEFETLLIKLLPQNLPTIFLEGFEWAQREALRSWPPFANKLASSIGWYFNDFPFKFRAASTIEAGGSLHAIQMGGGFGTYRAAPMEDFEKRVADRRHVWGWADQDLVGCRNLPSVELSRVSPGNQKDSSGQKNILFITTTFPRYFYRFHSSPVGGQMESYFEGQHRFVSSIPDNLRNRVHLRLPTQRHWGQSIGEKLLSRYPALSVVQGPSLHRQFGRYSMIVLDNMCTAYLEAMLTNIPLVLFWDPHRWEVRESARPFFDGLRKARILWDTPEQAAAHVQKVFEEPSSWWKAAPAQEARRAFIDHFAYTSPRWANAWVDAFSR